jgi:N-acetylglucosamine-6-phosphate deacetylase
MNSALIKNGKIIYKNSILENHSILVRDKRIALISSELEDYPANQVIDAQNNFVSPGFIDVHTHGGIGIDFMDASVEEISTVLKWMAGNGVVGVVPTIASAKLEDQIRMVKILREAHELEPIGARIIGIHLEGPYLSVEKRGAQPLDALRKPDLDEINQLVEFSGGLVKMISIAPELQDALTQG